MTKIVFEKVVPLFDDPYSVYNGGIEVEDDGQTVIHEFGSEGEGLFVRLQSWADRFKGRRIEAGSLARNHPDFAKLTGQRVRITVETIEEEI